MCGLCYQWLKSDLTLGQMGQLRTGELLLLRVSAGLGVGQHACSCILYSYFTTVCVLTFMLCYMYVHVFK